MPKALGRICAAAVAGAVKSNRVRLNSGLLFLSIAFRVSVVFLSCVRLRRVSRWVRA